MGNSVLHAEHEVLGATFVEVAEDLPAPESYFGEAGASELLEGCALVDLSCYVYRLVSGEASPALMAATCTNEPLAVGECAFSPMLTGDGSLASVPLVLRTGDTEYALIDASPRAEVMQGWLSFVEGIEQNGYAPFGSVEDESAQEMLVPLMLAGSDATAVISDYVSGPDALPREGKVVSTKLDRIQSLVARVPWGLDVPCYIAMVPSQVARVVWRSLLSFPAVSPMGRRGLSEVFARLPFGAQLAETSRVELAADTLSSWGLLRDDRTFIGARTLR